MPTDSSHNNDPAQITDTDRVMMTRALELAAQAADQNEVPVGAIIYRGDEIVSVGSNLRENSNDPTAHAEIIAIQNASKKFGQWRLLDCTLLVTLEPCPMCAGAAVNARIPRLIFGCLDPKMGSVRTLHQLCDDPNFNHQIQILSGLESQKCGKILSDFFQKRRSENKLKKLQNNPKLEQN